jgi:hypothetical protein
VQVRTAVGLNDGALGIDAWRLLRDSQFYASGTGASTPGVDIDGLSKRLAGVTGTSDMPATRRRP